MFMGLYSDTDMATFCKYRSISSIVIMIKGDGPCLVRLYDWPPCPLYIYSKHMIFLFLYINLYFKTCKYFGQKINLLTYYHKTSEQADYWEVAPLHSSFIFSKQLIYFIKTDDNHVIRNFYFAAFELIKKSQQYILFLWIKSSARKRKQ